MIDLKVDWDEYALNLDLTRFENLRAVRMEPSRIEWQFQCALERQCRHSFTRKFSMQMYALGPQSGTTVLYHS